MTSYTQSKTPTETLSTPPTGSHLFSYTISSVGHNVKYPMKLRCKLFGHDWRPLKTASQLTGRPIPNSYCYHCHRWNRHIKTEYWTHRALLLENLPSP